MRMFAHVMRAPMADSIASRNRLNELDALRGIGALLVVNFHYSTRFTELFPTSGHVPFHMFGGNYRVLLFFAISGFAIFFSLRKLRSADDFIVGRAVRLLPAYWVAMMLTLLIEHLGHMTALYVPPLAVVAGLTMLEEFFFLPPVDGAYWTLTVEIAFYACVLMAWILCRMRHVERLILGWLLLKLVFALIWTDMPERIVMILILRFMPFLAIGMASYRVWAGERSWRQQAPIFAAILATIAICETPDLLVAGLIIMGCFWALVGGYLRWLCVAPLLWFGQISYSLYLVHQHIGFTILYNMDQAGYSPTFAYIVAVATAVALAALINRFVERPGARYLPALWTRAKAGLLDRPASDAQPKPELSANDDPAPDHPLNEALRQRVP